MSSPTYEQPTSYGRPLGDSPKWTERIQVGSCGKLADISLWKQIHYDIEIILKTLPSILVPSDIIARFCAWVILKAVDLDVGVT